MNNLTFTYSPNIRDYHAAVYFATVTRHRMGFRILALSALVAAVSTGGGYLGLFPTFMLPAYIFLGYLVWALFICAQTEHSILKYAKSKDSILQKEITLSFMRDSVSINTPYNGKQDTVKLENLFFGFELSNMFLIYLDGAQSLMLPIRVMTPQQRANLRELLQDHMHERFSTRFGYASKASKLKMPAKRRFF